MTLFRNPESLIARSAGTATAPAERGVRAALAWIGLLVLAAVAAVLAAAWFLEEHLAWTGFVLYVTGVFAIGGRLGWYLLERRPRGDEPGSAWRLGCRAAADATLAAPLLLLDSLGVQGLGIAAGVAIFLSDAFDRLAEGPPRSNRPLPWFSGILRAVREGRLPGALPPG